MDPISDDDSGDLQDRNKRQKTCDEGAAAAATISPEVKRDAETARAHSHVNFLHTALGAPPSSIQLFRHPTIPQSQVIARTQHAMACLKRLDDYLQQYSGYLDNQQWRELHGFLVLHFSSLFFGGFSANHDDHQKMEIVTIICRCLKQVYGSASHKQQPIHEPDNLQVAMELLLEHANPLVQETMRRCRRDGTPVKRSAASELVPILLETFLLLVPNLESITTKLSDALHEFIAHLLGNYESFLASEAKDNCTRIIGQLPRTKPTEHSAVMRPDESVRKWRCEAQSEKEATKLSQKMEVLDKLVGWALQEEKDKTEYLQLRAAECLSIIATNEKRPQRTSTTKGSTDETKSRHTVDWTMDALLKVLTGATNLRIKRATVPGLQYCQPAKIPWQNTKFLGEVLCSLALIVGTSQEWPRRKSSQFKCEAATILLDIVAQNQAPVLANENITVLPFQQAMSFVGDMLLMYDDPKVQHLAVHWLVRETKQNGPRLVFAYPGILNDLGSLCCDPLTLTDIKHRTMEIFEAISRTPKTLTILARQVRVLDALVTVAAGRSSHDNGRIDARTKDLALVVLVRLSQDVCNRRIVATHVGVVSCLIRCARAYSTAAANQQQAQQPQNNSRVIMNDTGDSIPGVSLDHLKQKIMELTVAI